LLLPRVRVRDAIVEQALDELVLLARLREAMLGEQLLELRDLELLADGVSDVMARNGTMLPLTESFSGMLVETRRKVGNADGLYRQVEELVDREAVDWWILLSLME